MQKYIYSIGKHNSLSKLLKTNIPLVSLCQSYGSKPVDADYLHKSIVPTDHFQKSLPRLPIPPLMYTLHRFAWSASEIITAVDHEGITKLVRKQFKDEKFKRLNQELIARDKKNKHTSYISKPWFDMYLKYRPPLVLNHNPFISFQDDPRPEYQNQLIRSTNMVVSSLKFMKTLRANILEPDIYHLKPAESDTVKFRKFVRWLPKSVSFYGAYWYQAFPLDMSQYKNLFNSTRIPKHGKDELVTDPGGRHLVVMRNGYFYVFDVIDESGNIVDPGIIMANIHKIMQQPNTPAEYPVGVFTSENRDLWATYREKLTKLGNEENLHLIDSAVFVLVLDDVKTDDPNKITKLFLHGEAGKRWFDKSFMLILTGDGKASVNFEHAWGDGVAVVRYFNEVFKDSTENSVVHPSTNVDVNAANFKELEFKLDSEMKENIEESTKKFNALVDSLDVHHLHYDTYTKTYVKKSGMSPDSLMQLAIQMAYYRQNRGKRVSTYESCSTAAFKHGRTETVRPVTYWSKKSCSRILDSQFATSLDLIQSYLKDCSNEHTDLIKKAAMGQGFDRHLFALKALAEEKGEEYEIFSSKAYKTLNHNILSTSTVSSPAILIGGFAPVVPDGYGVGYSIEDNRIGFNVSSYPATDARDFIECLRKSLDDIYDVLEGRRPRHVKRRT